MAVFIGLNLLWGWNRLLYSTDYDHYGYLTIANGGLALLFSARNNLFALIARVPSAVLLMYHRWAGIATAVHATIHLYGETHDWIIQHQVALEFTNTRIQVGLVAWLSLCLVFFTSLGFIRRNFFEVFYYAHALVIAFIVGALIHAEHAPEFLLPGLCLWFVDRLTRFVHNFRPVDVVSATTCPGGVIKFKLHGVRPRHPGQIVWVQFPAVSFFDWHPFTIASAPDNNETTLLLKGLGSYTRQIQELITEKESRDIPAESLPLKIRIDGPYGIGHIRWGVHPVTILVAGGAGITPGISIASHIIQQASRADVEITRGQTWNVHLLWMVRHQEHARWFSGELAQLSDIASRPELPATLDITIAITGIPTPRDSAPQPDEVSTTRDSHTGGDVVGQAHFIHGRPNISQYFQAISNRYRGMDAAVNVCGPRPLIWSVRRAAAKWSGQNVIFDVEEEVFEF